MTIKIKFSNPVSQNKFLHNLVCAKKSNTNYKHFYHTLLDEAKDKVSFRINDEDRAVIAWDIDFYPDENLVDIECHPCDIDKLQSLVFDLLESINEKAWVRLIDTKFFYNGGMEFFVIMGGAKQELYKLSVDRNSLLSVEGYHIPMEVREGQDYIF